jgi:hypothetical protein
LSEPISHSTTDVTEQYTYQWEASLALLAMLHTHARVTVLQAMHASVMDGLALFAVAGDSEGRISFWNMKGDFLAEHDTGLFTSGISTAHLPCVQKGV